MSRTDTHPSDTPPVASDPMDTGPTFTSVQVCDLTGVSYRQLDYWLRTGVLVVPDATPGSGGRRRFDRGFVEQVAMIHRLLGAGLHLERLRGMFPLPDGEPVRLPVAPGVELHAEWCTLEALLADDPDRWSAVREPALV